LVKLRVIILHDAVILKQAFPSHAIFAHPVFLSEEFITFSEELVLAIKNTPLLLL
jgi:hypothetical protein